MLYCRKQLASYLIVEYAIFFIHFQVLCNLCYLAGRWKIHCTDADVILFFMGFKKEIAYHYVSLVNDFHAQQQQQNV